MASADLIQLPRLTAPEAAALLGELLSAADRAETLPAGIERSKKRLYGAHVQLESAITGIPVEAADADLQRVADRAIDNAWEATHQWLSGWVKLPLSAHSHLDRAYALHNRIFSDGIRFTKLPYKVQFSESKARLETIERDGHEETFAVLGGSAFLSELYRTHRDYETALKPLLDSDDVPMAVHEQMGTALGALRQYVARVASYADPGVAGSEALSAALLAPLARWHRLHPMRDAGESEAPDDSIYETARV